MWHNKKVWQKNRQAGYQRPDKDPSVLRRRKIRKFIAGAIIVLVFYAIIIVKIDRVVCFFEPGINTTSAISAQVNPPKPTPLVSNAFQLGHGLTQMQYAKTDDLEYNKWKNKVVVHLAALGLDFFILHPAMEDCKLTLNETSILCHQIREKMKKLHGIKAASTFVVGVELIPVTQAFEAYLIDNDFKSQLAKSNVSILQLGSLLNSNIDEADFPKNFKINLITEFTRAYQRDDTRIKLYRITRFREKILNYFSIS